MSDRSDEGDDAPDTTPYESEDELAERLRRARLEGALHDEPTGTDEPAADAGAFDGEPTDEPPPPRAGDAGAPAEDTVAVSGPESEVRTDGAEATLAGSGSGSGSGSRFRVDIDDDHVEDDLGAAATIPSARAQEREARGNGGAATRGRGAKRFARRFRGTGVVVVVLVVVALAAIPVVKSAFAKTPRDKFGITYGGGPIEGEHFQRIVQPGTGLFFNGFGDSLFLYPADQRNYIVYGGDAGDVPTGTGSTIDSSAIQAPTKDRVMVSYQVAVYFKLHIDQLRQFHEEIGLRYRAYTQKGWNSMIQDNFRQQIENALQEQTRRYDVADLFASVDVLLSMQSAVQETLSARLESALGDNYFCSPNYSPGGECGTPTFQIKRIDVPDSVQQAFELNRTSAIDVQSREAEARSIESLSDALEKAGDDYVLLRAVESGKVSFWVLPSNGDVSITTPPGSADAPTTPAESPDPPADGG